MAEPAQAAAVDLVVEETADHLIRLTLARDGGLSAVTMSRAEARALAEIIEGMSRQAGHRDPAARRGGA